MQRLASNFRKRETLQQDRSINSLLADWRSQLVIALIEKDVVRDALTVAHRYPLVREI